MPTITIYLPDDLYEYVKSEPSRKIQEALKMMIGRESQ